MTRSTLPLIALFATLFACDEGGDPQTFTIDDRIDGLEEDNNVDSTGTRMCVTDDGVVYVLWLDNRADPSEDTVDIYMNHSTDLGETWQPTPTLVNQGDAEKPGPGQVENPDLHCNELGVFVVWEDDRDGELENHQIYFNRSTDNGENFLPEDVLLEFDDEGDTMSLEPRITGSGPDLMVGWYDSANGAYDIFVTTSTDLGDTWRDSTRVDSDVPAGNAYSARPKVAMSRNSDSLWVVWEDSRDGKADIYFSGSTNGGVTFSDDVRLDEGTDVTGVDEDGENDSFEPQLCTDGVSNLYVVWHDSRNNINQRDIFFNYSLDSGQNWLRDARQLDSDGVGAANSLYPVCEVQGPVAHVAWQDNRNMSYDIYYRRIIDGIPEAEAEQRADIGDEGLGNSLDVVMDMNDQGTVVVAWNDGREEARVEGENGYTDLYYQFFDSEGVLGSPDGNADQDYRIDSMYSGQSFKLDLNVAIVGNQVYAAWTDGRGRSEDIYFDKWDLGTEADPPDLSLLLGN